MTVTLTEAEVGTFDNPADERVYGMKVAVVAARGPFGIVRGIAVTYGSYVQRTLSALRTEVAQHVGTMTDGVYWSQHVYEGVPWYVGLADDARERSNGIWLWRWKPPSRWDHRSEWGDSKWTACTDGFCKAKVRIAFGTLELLAGKDGAQDWVPVPVGHWLVHPPGDTSDVWPVDPDYFAAKYDLVTA